jgi:hypothetical protein
MYQNKISAIHTTWGVRFSRKEFDVDTVQFWCEDCKEVVDVVPEKDYEVIDGRTYVSDTIYTCPNGDNHELSEIRHCPICGNEMSEWDEFCADCHDTALQALTELKEYLHADQSEFEDLITNVMEW